MSCRIELDKQIGAHFTKRDFELILSSLNDTMRAKSCDDPEYKEIMNIYEYIDESYNELLEDIEKAGGYDDE